MQETTTTCDNCGITAVDGERDGWFDVTAKVITPAPLSSPMLCLNFHAISCLIEFLQLKKYEPLLAPPTPIVPPPPPTPLPNE